MNKEIIDKIKAWRDAEKERLKVTHGVFSDGMVTAFDMVLDLLEEDKKIK